MKKNITEKIDIICNYVKDLKKAKLFNDAWEKYNDDIYENYGANNMDNLEIIGIPIVSFLLYMGNVRRIGWIKIGFIRDYFELDIKTNMEVSSFITEYGVFKKEFEQRIPLLINMFIDMTIKKKKRNKNANNMAMELYELYEMIGREYLTCDKSEIMQDDVERYILYLDMIKTNIDRRLENESKGN